MKCKEEDHSSGLKDLLLDEIYGGNFQLTYGFLSITAWPRQLKLRPRLSRSRTVVEGVLCPAQRNLEAVRAVHRRTFLHEN